MSCHSNLLQPDCFNLFATVNITVPVQVLASLTCTQDAGLKSMALLILAVVSCVDGAHGSEHRGMEVPVFDRSVSLA